MPFAIKGKIDGLSELLQSLDGLEAKVRKKALRAAVGKAGQIVLKAARSKARRVSGLLKKSLGRKVKVYRSSGVVVAIVGPRVGYRQEVERGGRTVLSNPVKYAHLVELGTAPHSYRTRGGSHPGAKAYPFLKPAFDDSAAQCQDAMTDILKEALGLS